jgi:20S proteasome alpha/beta subunit
MVLTVNQRGIQRHLTKHRKNKRLFINKRYQCEKHMTVCIAAISEEQTEYPKIVIAADREVTTDWISYTSGVGKIRVLTKYCWVMISTNNALIAQDIITQSINELNKILKNTPDEIITIEQIAKLISSECKYKMDLTRERVALSPHGLNYDSYIKRSKEFSREHIEIITNDLKDFETQNYNFTAEFLVVGIDLKPHVFVVVQNGEYASSDVEGFFITGGGRSTAFPEFTKYPFNPNASWLYTLHRVYTAKKAAERVGGVGPDTDLIVLHKLKDGDVSYWIADENTKKLLDSGIKEVRDKEIAIYNDLLKKFSDLLLSSEPDKLESIKK